MIIFLFGKDRAIRKRAYDYLKTHGIVTDYVYKEDCSDNDVLRLVESNSLFRDKSLIVLENCVTLLHAETLEKAKVSPHVLFFDELDAVKVPEDITKYAEHVFDAIVKKEKDPFPFGLCNAIKRRDKKEAWIEFLTCKKRGEAEVLHGAILWQIRSIHKDIIEGKKHAYSEKEIQHMHEHLVTIYHDAHNGKLDLMDGLEMFVMSV